MSVSVNRSREALGGSEKNMSKSDGKSFAIPKLMVWEAWRQVKANKGALATSWLERYRQFWDESWTRLDEHLRQPPTAQSAARSSACGRIASLVGNPPYRRGYA